MTHVPPPFDPELAGGIQMLADLDLTMGGTFEVEDRQVPGPQNEPDISLLICRPTAPATAGARPVIYHVHGGGMVIGPATSTGRGSALGQPPGFGVRSAAACRTMGL